MFAPKTQHTTSRPPPPNPYLLLVVPQEELRGAWGVAHLTGKAECRPSVQVQLAPCCDHRPRLCHEKNGGDEAEKRYVVMSRACRALLKLLRDVTPEKAKKYPAVRAELRGKYQDTSLTKGDHSLHSF